MAHGGGPAGWVRNRCAQALATKATLPVHAALRVAGEAAHPCERGAAGQHWQAPSCVLLRSALRNAAREAGCAPTPCSSNVRAKPPQATRGRASTAGAVARG